MDKINILSEGERFNDINEKLLSLPEEKAQAFEEYCHKRLWRDGVRANIFIQKRSINEKAAVAVIEALVDIDEEVQDATRESFLAEAKFKRFSDLLDSYMEIARNERSLLRNIDPSA